MNRPTLALVIAVCLLLLPGSVPAVAQNADPTSVTKTVCASTFGYAGLEPLKEDLLLRAKLAASNELFGELIAAATTVENLVVTADEIRTQSLGLIRVRGSVTYANGPNLAEVCATITAFATAEDRAQFTPEVISGRACINEALTLPDLRAKTESAARIRALTDFDGRLQDFADSAILPLLRRIDYNESGVLTGTDTYCATVVGAVIPIEVQGFLSLGGVLVDDATAPTTATAPAVRTTPSPAAIRTPATTPTPTPARTMSAVQATATAAQATVEAYQSRTPTPTPTFTPTPDRAATAVAATAAAIGTVEAKAAAALAATAQAIATAEAWGAQSAGARAAVMATAAATGHTVYDVWINPVDGAAYVYVPAGAFIMGSAQGSASEQPAHRVDLDAFWIMRTEVTNAQYGRCVDAGVCTAPHSDQWQETRKASPSHPVTYVDWTQAAVYAKWVGGSLPTEAQWEKACRGDDQRTYPWGNQQPSAGLFNVQDSGVDGTSSVGSYPSGASPYGVLDMAGNVWEWVADWYDDRYYAQSPAENPTGPENGSYRLMRGGSSRNDADGVRCAYRLRYGPISRNGYAGFRVVSPG